MAHEHDNGMTHTQTQTHIKRPAMQHSLQLPLLVLLYTSVRSWFGVQSAHSRDTNVSAYLSCHCLQTSFEDKDTGQVLSAVDCYFQCQVTTQHYSRVPPSTSSPNSTVAAWQVFTNCICTCSLQSRLA